MLSIDHLLPFDTCLNCQAVFYSRHSVAKFCSHKCSELYYTGKKRPNTSEALTKFYEVHPEAAEELRQRAKETQFKEGHDPYITKPWQGKKHGEETKQKMSVSHIMFNFEHPEVADQIGKAHSGPNHWNWKGGITDETKRLRQTEEYNAWRKMVYIKNNYTCQDCGAKDDLVAHHLKGFREYEELRFDVDNGITLCRPCHKKRHTEVGLSTRFR